MKQGWGAQRRKNFLIRGTPYAKGRVLRQSASNQGGRPPSAMRRSAMPWRLTARAPKFDGGIAYAAGTAFPFSVVVKQARPSAFYNEGEDVWPKRYAIWGRLVAQQPDQVAYSIIDSRSERSVHAVRLPPPSRRPPIGELGRPA